jgi:predicted permease
VHFPLLSTLARASRSLRRSPQFVAIATLSLGAALGLSTGVFALIDSVRHPRSPIRDVGQVYELRARTTALHAPRQETFDSAFARMRGVQSLAWMNIDFTEVEAAETVERTTVAHVGPGFFGLLGVPAKLGRLLGDSESVANVAVVSSGFWRRRFADRRKIGDAHISAGPREYAVVGVMPDRVDTYTDVWIPAATPEAAGFHSRMVRLGPGIAPRDLQPQVDAFLKRYTQLYVGPREPHFAGQFWSQRPDILALTDMHYVMIGAAICVLLIACANVAALMLARGVVRRRDYALRIALGATGGEIAREVLVELALLAVAGSVAGAIVATWVVGLITRANPDELHWLGFAQPQWSARVLALSAVAVFGAVALAGGFPAWQASRTDPAGLLKEGSGGSTGRTGTRFRVLITAELAIAMTLMMGAALLIKSAEQMASRDFGYDARTLLGAEVSFPRGDSTRPAIRNQLLREALARLRAIPGVRAAAMTTECIAKLHVVTTDRTIEGGAAGYLPYGCSAVSPDYFTTLGRLLSEGRDFTDGDVASGGAVIIDQRSARLLFPHESAVGRMVKLGNLASDRPWLRVVGVVRDRPEDDAVEGVSHDSSVTVFASIPGVAATGGRFLVHPTSGAHGVGIAVARTLRTTLPPRSGVLVGMYLGKWVESLRKTQFFSLVFTLLGAASLALGAAGIFSVVSYLASQRMREFAVRMALGATNENVFRLVLRDALVMVLSGTAIGAAIAMRAGFTLWDQMYGDLYPVDAGVLVSTEAVLLVATMLACLAPALRAMRADPVDVMRAT